MRIIFSDRRERECQGVVASVHGNIVRERETESERDGKKELE